MQRIPDDIIDQVTAVARPAGHCLRGDDRAGGIAFDFALGVVHEWITAETTHSNRTQWLAPHGVLLALAWHMLRADDAAHGSATHSRVIVWIGRRVWPSPRAMIAVDGSRALLARSIFVDPSADRSRSALANHMWAVQQSLACDEVMTVIWDASGCDLTATRRMQLAAAREKERPPVLALAVRPWCERTTLTCAATRWSVTPHVCECTSDTAPDRSPHWRAELLRARGALGSQVGSQVGGQIGRQVGGRVGGHVGECSFVVGATWSWSGG